LIEKDFKFIEVAPIEYQVNSNISPRIIRFRNIKYSKRLDPDKLERIVREIHTRRRVKIDRDSKHHLFWLYANQPLIILDLISNKIGTTEKTLKFYRNRKCQIQASIVLKVLKRYGLVSFRRVSLTVNPGRIGHTRKDRQITYNAWEEMLRSTSYAEGYI
jgi:hypothetical protein